MQGRLEREARPHARLEPCKHEDDRPYRLRGLRFVTVRPPVFSATLEPNVARAVTWTTMPPCRCAHTPFRAGESILRSDSALRACRATRSLHSAPLAVPVQAARSRRRVQARADELDITKVLVPSCVYALCARLLNTRNVGNACILTCSAWVRHTAVSGGCFTHYTKQGA